MYSLAQSDGIATSTAHLQHHTAHEDQPELPNMSAPNTSAPIVSGPTTPAPTTPVPIVAAPVVSAPIASGGWENGLCSNVCGGEPEDCVRTLLTSPVPLASTDALQLLANCCPCFLYGRAAQRLDFYPRNNDSEIQTFDKHCCIFTLAGCFSLACLPIAFKRREMRNRLGIAGNLCEDFAVSAMELVTSCLPC